MTRSTTACHLPKDALRNVGEIVEAGWIGNDFHRIRAFPEINSRGTR
jgi:hypothetical protein